VLVLVLVSPSDSATVGLGLVSDVVSNALSVAGFSKRLVYRPGPDCSGADGFDWLHG
jgi:hypothetical protein